MDFKNSKILGGVGALIMVFGGILTLLFNYLFFSNKPLVNFFLDMNISGYIVALIVGMVLILISMYNLSKFYQAKNIFTNAFIGVVLVIIVAISYSIVAYILPLPSSYLLVWLPFLFIFWLVCIIAMVFVRRSLTALAKHSNTLLLAITGELLFFSTTLFIVIIGLILLPILLMMLAIAFFKIKTLPAPLSNTHP